MEKSTTTNQKASYDIQLLKEEIIRHLEGQSFRDLEFVFYYLLAGERGKA